MNIDEIIEFVCWWRVSQDHRPLKIFMQIIISVFYGFHVTRDAATLSTIHKYLYSFFFLISLNLIFVMDLGIWFGFHIISGFYLNTFALFILRILWIYVYLQSMDWSLWIVKTLIAWPIFIFMRFIDRS